MQTHKICVVTSLGFWLSIIRDQFQNKDSIFMRAGTHYCGTKNYAAQLKEMSKPHHRAIMSMGASTNKKKSHGF